MDCPVASVISLHAGQVSLCYGPRNKHNLRIPQMMSLNLQSIVPSTGTEFVDTQYRYSLELITM